MLSTKAVLAASNPPKNDDTTVCHPSQTFARISSQATINKQPQMSSTTKHFLNRFDRL
jgi:hypothetical protein